MTRRSRAGKPARFTLRYATRTDTDLSELGELDPALVDAALGAVDDLVHGRQTGKLLGDRHVTGDLTGLARLRFDLPGQRPARFRIVYRLAEHDTGHRAGRLPVIEILAIGERADHAVYREALIRVSSAGERPGTRR